tara:strand:- start:8710 stop:9135 length:426 start_codon:yes stop_codon:yes gene_type:complete
MSTYNILKGENNKTKNIFNELTVESLNELLQTYSNTNNHIIIKLGATWCGPCQKIKNLCNNLFIDLPDNVICYDLDIDDNFELYGAFRTKKMVKGIPAIFHYNCKMHRDNWFICDKFVSGSDISSIVELFTNVNTLAKENS